MTKRGKVARRRSANETAHRRAMPTLKVREMIKALRLGWADMGRLVRGERLCELTSLGCSARGLEQELHQSATSIRRHIVLAGLPERDREEIKAGASAKKILDRKMNEDRETRRRQRIVEDGRTGALSDEVAGTILEFCQAKEGPHREPVYGERAHQLFRDTLWTLSVSDASGHRAAWASNTRGKARIFYRTRPPEAEETVWMSYLTEWLANVVWAMAPERQIWENALEKARSRVGELTPKPDPPIVIMLNTQQRRAELYVSSARPRYKGASSLQRQGKPTLGQTNKAVY